MLMKPGYTGPFHTIHVGKSVDYHTVLLFDDHFYYYTLPAMPST